MGLTFTAYLLLAVVAALIAIALLAAAVGHLLDSAGRGHPRKPNPEQKDTP